MRVVTKSIDETKKLAKNMARNLLSHKTTRDSSIVIALGGELGSGKTTFVQGFLEYFGVKRATSPTFVIMKKYHIPGKSNINLYHIDCYRIKSSRDLLELGFEEIISDARNIVLIEWGERIKDILPDGVVWVRFGHKGEEERVIEIL